MIINRINQTAKQFGGFFVCCCIFWGLPPKTATIRQPTKIFMPDIEKNTKLRGHVLYGQQNTWADANRTRSVQLEIESTAGNFQIQFESFPVFLEIRGNITIQIAVWASGREARHCAMAKRWGAGNRRSLRRFDVGVE